MRAILDRTLGLVERTARRLRERSRRPAGFADLGMHLWMLGDDVRAQAYESAIDRAVRPGDVVVDVGTGTGLLAMMACRAGAARVYAIEETEVHRLARRIIEANGLSDRITLIEGNSRRIDLPERADVVVSETIGSFVLSEGIAGTLHDARRRFLKESGRLIPSRIRVMMSPVECFREGTGFWERPVRGFDYAPALDHVAAGVPVAARRIEPGDALAPPSPLYDLDFTIPEEAIGFDRTLLFTARRDGRLHGFVGSWEAHLHEGIVLRCAPEAPPVHWPPLLFRIPKGLPVRAGERIRLTFVRRDPSRWSWGWEAAVEREQPDPPRPLSIDGAGRGS